MMAEVPLLRWLAKKNEVGGKLTGASVLSAAPTQAGGAHVHCAETCHVPVAAATTCHGTHSNSAIYALTLHWLPRSFSCR